MPDRSLLEIDGTSDPFELHASGIKHRSVLTTTT
jgi:hypothetical protein